MQLGTPPTLLRLSSCGTSIISMIHFVSPLRRPKSSLYQMVVCSKDSLFTFLTCCALPALCSSLCCLTAPPEFTLRHPPRPPSTVLNVHCQAEEKRSGSLGMVLGLVTGFIMLLLFVLLSYILIKRKQIKYHIEQDSDVEHKTNMLFSYKQPSWFWRNGCNTSKKFVNLFKGVQKTGSISSTSSESGYCEEVLETHDSNIGESKTVVLRRSTTPRQRSGNTRSTAITDATPDIIASTQKDPLDDVPKRWSMFGLLPSLKPVLVFQPDEPEDTKFHACHEDIDMKGIYSDSQCKKEKFLKGNSMNPEKAAVELCPLARSTRDEKDPKDHGSVKENIGYKNSKVCIQGGGNPPTTEV